MRLIIVPIVMFIGFLLGYLYATEVRINELKKRSKEYVYKKF
jgi:hypothetical protein